ncbi:HDOD domain-containing protein [Alkaliphilus crotonatoxidans]
MATKQITLQEIISRVEDIPTLPDTITRIIQLTDDANSTVQDIEREVLKDQSLTTKILRLANSAYYGYPRTISTISQATVLLGFQTVRSMALSATVSNILDKELEGYALESKALLRQSQACAMISRFLAKKLRFSKAENAYVAGLLRDIGKVILNYYITEQYQQVINEVETRGITFLEAEEMILGFNHAEVGAKIAEKWNLPEELVEAIAYHHTPDRAKVNEKMTAIVHVSDAMIMMMGMGLGIDGLAYRFSPHALELLKLDELDLQQYMAEASDFLVDEDSFHY